MLKRQIEKFDRTGSIVNEKSSDGLLPGRSIKCIVLVTANVGDKSKNIDSPHFAAIGHFYKQFRRILKKNLHLNPYSKVQLIQELKPGNYAQHRTLNVLRLF